MVLTATHSVDDQTHGLGYVTHPARGGINLTICEIGGIAEGSAGILDGSC